MRFSAFALLLCALAVGRTTTVLATEPQSSAAAETLFRQGRELMTAGKYAEACDKLAASQRLDPGAGTLLNLAACYRALGRTASAWATYRDAVAAANRTGRSDWESNARARAAELESAISYLTIDVPPQSRVEGLLVQRDGNAVDPAEWGAPIPIDPGSHTITASAAGRQPFTRNVDIGAQPVRAEVSIPTLAPAAAPAPSSIEPPGATTQPPNPIPPPARNEPTPSAGRTAGLVLGGVGIVSAGIGTWLGLDSRSRYQDALGYCDAQRRCDPEGLRLNESAHDRATYANVAFGIGAVALLGGIILYVTSPKRQPDRPPLAASLTPSPGGCTLDLGGIW